jgi:hypothetical protein
MLSVVLVGWEAPWSVGDTAAWVWAALVEGCRCSAALVEGCRCSAALGVELPAAALRSARPSK